MSEYKPKEEEYSAPEYTPPEEEQPKTARFKFLPRNKKIIVILGVLIVLFIVYHFIAPKRAKQIPAKKEAETPQIQVAPELTSQQITVLNQQISDNSAKITTLKNSLTSQQQKLANMEKALANLNIGLQILDKDIEQLKVHTAITGPRTKFRPRPKTRYHIRAIVSGRAWLENGRGLVITVRPGAELNGYGKVTKIDSEKGLVMTSSGFVIGYGVNDI